MSTTTTTRRRPQPALEAPTKRLVVLVSGSRDWADPVVIELALQMFSNHRSVTVMHGACPTGADEMADRAARNLGFKVDRHPARWKRPDGSLDKGAGFARNKRMVDKHPDVGLFFIRNNSRGATHCLTLAQRAGVDCEVWRVNDEPSSEPERKEEP